MAKREMNEMEADELPVDETSGGSFVEVSNINFQIFVYFT